MKKIDQALKALYGRRARITEKIFFYSKKNQVTRLLVHNGKEQLDMVMKYCIWGDSKKEARVIARCNELGLRVPLLKARQGNILFLETVEDSRVLCYKSFTDDLKSAEKTLTASLIEWLRSFHETFLNRGKSLVKGDLNFNNFLVKDGVVWGIDFEECRRGNPMEDYADFFALLIEMETAEKGVVSWENARRFARECRLRGVGLESPEVFLFAELEKRAAYKKQSGKILSKLSASDFSLEGV